MKVFMVIGCLCVLLGSSSYAQAFVVINEILADPASGLAGDSNGDGVRSTSQDEFVELMNYSADHVNVGGWILSDNTKTRHVFQVDTILDPFSFLVVFGGGDPTFGDFLWQTSSTGSLGLNNGGDKITLWDVDGGVVDQVIYRGEAGDNQSIVREEDGSGLVFDKHSVVDSRDHKLYSPGKFSIEKELVDFPETTTVPEPATMFLFSTGVGMLMRKKLLV